VIDEPTRRLDEGALRALVPRVLAGLVRRGEDFDAAEDALQEALLEALRVWPEHPPRDPRAWLATVATRRLVDARRSEAARHRREEATYAEPRPAATEEGDDTRSRPRSPPCTRRRKRRGDRLAALSGPAALRSLGGMGHGFIPPKRHG
jgi:DNA-directed RNA polymerase specialized sigma24 family protein